MKEEWKIIPGFEEYEASNLGRIMSHKGRTGKGDIILRPNITRNGYAIVSLRNNKHKKYRFLLHRIIATLFIPNPDNKPTVNHKNENKSDNRACNLEWATHSEQINYGSLKRPDVPKQILDENGKQPKKLIEERRLLKIYGYILDDSQMIAYWTIDTHRLIRKENNPRFYKFRKYNGEYVELPKNVTRRKHIIEQIDVSGNIVEFPSISAASRSSGSSWMSIYQCLQGLSKQSRGYKYRYKA